MPRRRRSYRRGDNVLVLFVLLILAFILLMLVENGRTVQLPVTDIRIPDIDMPDLNLPDLPRVSIPITGLPRIEIPRTEIKIPITVVPGTLMPKVEIAGTPAPAGGAIVGPQTKTSNCQLQGSLPDRGCTPGGIVTSDPGQVCSAGFDTTPNGSPTLRDSVFDAYNIPAGSAGQYQLDHLVPLSLGGSDESANVWPQPVTPAPGYEAKNQLEEYLRAEVCGGRISLVDAQRRFATDWVAAYNDMPK